MAPSLIALYSPVMQSGKSEIAKTLQLSRGFKLVKFADPFRSFIRDLLVQGGASPEAAERMVEEGALKERVIPGLGVSVRTMLQTAGSDWGRQRISPDLWVKLAEIKVKRTLEAGVPVVIDDLRFPNEYEMVLRLGGHPVKVVRSGTRPYQGHASEGLLEGYPMTVLQNNSSLGELRACAEQLPEILTQQSTY